jgi:hypothetical protein
LYDGATPIVVLDTEDILLSLQKATLKNKEAHENKDHSENRKVNGSK